MRYKAEDSVLCAPMTAEKPKKDIETAEDIRLLVDSFYEKVKQDAVIGFFFNDIARVDWSKHLPKMYAFWGSVLLGEGEYSGAPFAPHNRIHHQVPIEKEHFAQWVQLFQDTVNELFSGEKANEAKTRGAYIAAVWHIKLERMGKPQTPTTTTT